MHASLKRWYAEEGDQVEAPVDGYVIDLVRDPLLIEIQTRGFSGMKAKIMSLLDLGHRIRIVHPIAVDRWIVKVDDEGTILSKRRSPKHGRVVDVFAELVSFPELLTDPGLDVEVILTREEEYRRHTPGTSWRRRGWTVMERRLVDVVDTFLIADAAAAASLLPKDLPESFTTSDLAKSLWIRLRTAQQMAYCLRGCGVITRVGKRGNSTLYRIAAGF